MTLRILRFTVPGTPRPKLRARSGVIKKKGCDGTRREDYRSITYDAAQNREEQDRIWPWCRKAMHEQRFDRTTGPVALYVIASFLLPKSVSDAERMRRFWHVQKPDKDNLEKIVADALKDVAWEDDCAIPHGMQFKVWSSTWEGYEVWIAYLPESPAETVQAFRGLREVDAQFLDRCEALMFAGRTNGDGASLPLAGI